MPVRSKTSTTVVLVLVLLVAAPNLNHSDLEPASLSGVHWQLQVASGTTTVLRLLVVLLARPDSESEGVTLI